MVVSTRAAASERLFVAVYRTDLFASQSQHYSYLGREQDIAPKLGTMGLADRFEIPKEWYIAMRQHLDASESGIRLAPLGEIFIQIDPLADQSGFVARTIWYYPRNDFPQRLNAPGLGYATEHAVAMGMGNIFGESSKRVTHIEASSAVLARKRQLGKVGLVAEEPMEIEAWKEALRIGLEQSLRRHSEGGRQGI